jgi:O-antigen/teichoic acid export membrane protein
MPLIASIAVFAFAGSIAAFFSNPGLEGVLRILSLYIMLAQINTIGTSVLTALRRIKEIAISTVIIAAAKLAFTLMLVFFAGAAAGSVTWGFTLAFVAVVAYTAYYSLGAVAGIGPGKAISQREYVGLAKEILPFGLTMVIVVSFSSLLGILDRTMLGYYLGESGNAQLAIYSFANSLAGYVNIFAVTVLSLFLPIISGLFGKGDNEGIRKTSNTAMKWVIFTSIPLAAFMVSFASPLLSTIYGKSYEPGALTLLLFTLGIFISNISIIQRTMLAGMRFIKVELIMVAVAVAVNFILNIILIPLYGINGAAFASLCSCIVLAVLGQFYAGKIMGFAIPPSLWKNLAAGAITTAVMCTAGAFLYGQISGIIALDSSSLYAAFVGKAAKAAMLAVMGGITLLIYWALVNAFRLFDSEDRAVFGMVMGKVPLIGENKKAALSSLVFWNYKESERCNSV